eukprot:SAG31_NODE_31006_length_373_cov_1.182482_2_plen_21_part_01
MSQLVQYILQRSVATPRRSRR